MRTYKKLLIGVLGLTVIAGLCISHLNGQAQSKQKRDFSAVVEVQYYRNSPQDIVTLKIPEGYIRRAVVGAKIEGVQDQLYFEVLGPQLLPQTESNQTLFSFPRNLHGVITFSVSSLYRLRRDQIEERTQRNFESQAKDLFAPCKWRDEMQVTHGLHHRTIDSASCPDEPLYGLGRRDLYQLKTSNNNLATVIRCTPMEWNEAPLSEIDGVTPMPRTYCKHLFAVKAANGWVQLHYHRDFLPHWQQIEQSVENMLAAFIASN